MKPGTGVIVATVAFATVTFATVAFATTLSGAGAADPLASLGGGATGLAQAQPVPIASDVVTVVNRGSALAPDVITKAVTAAEASYGTWAMSRGASVGMQAVRRGTSFVQQAPPDFNFPMSTTALPPSAVAQLMGRPLAGVLSGGFVIMGRTTAGLRGAQIGDVVDMVSASGPIVSFAIGDIVDDSTIGGTEILMSTEQADSIGVTTDTRIVLWGFRSRELLDQNLRNAGLFAKPDVRIRHSWDPPDPDASLSLALTKVALGEFAYRIEPNGVDITVTDSWVAAHMPAGRVVLIEAIPIRARCNLTILADLRAALTEIDQAGLAAAIDVDNANAYGGCYYPRFNRVSGNLGFLSRHSWGQALDTNTTTNAQGAVPSMDCSVVRIFRKHNFAWGGDFLTPDGMHFEWVGTRRDQLQFPSSYCPNVVTGTAGVQPTSGEERVGTADVASGGGRVAMSSMATMLVADGR